MSIVQFDKPKLKRLSAAWERAVNGKRQLFDFEDASYDVNYAKFLIEYLSEYLVEANRESTTAEVPTI